MKSIEMRIYHKGNPLPADWFSVVNTDVRFNVACIAVRRPGMVEIRPVVASADAWVQEVGPHISGSSWGVSAEPALLTSREPFPPGGPLE